MTLGIVTHIENRSIPGSPTKRKNPPKRVFRPGIFHYMNGSGCMTVSSFGRICRQPFRFPQRQNTKNTSHKSWCFSYLSGRTGETVWETVARPGPHLSPKATTISQIVGSFWCPRPSLGRGAGNRTRTTRSQTAYTTTMLHPDPDRDET